jgi:phosphoribosylanthranilate isomerase
MHRTRIKICGVMRPDDASLAAAAGADAVGMIFHPPAKRNITIERAIQIVAALPPFVTPVGVFADATPAQIIDIAGAVTLRTVQLNGNETPDDVAALSRLRVIKAIRVSREGLKNELAPWRAAAPRNLIGLVMEPAGTGVAGGSGVANDWTTIATEIAAGTFDLLPPIIAAGGLTPETVADVVKMIHPWAVDVSSGVEAALGEKSPEKISAFVTAVRGA